MNWWLGVGLGALSFVGQGAFAEGIGEAAEVVSQVGADIEVGADEAFDVVGAETTNATSAYTESLAPTPSAGTRINLLKGHPIQPKPPGIRFGPPRGGGGSEAARTYAYRVTGGAEKATYVQGPQGTTPVEFEGVSGGILIDAKRAGENNSWYDISSADKFTRSVKIPEILKQAQRQVQALKTTGEASGLSGIRWPVANETVAKQLQSLFDENELNIRVIWVRP